MEGLNDSFKWFGEGFDGFPKTLPEDCVEYTIYMIDAKLQDIELRDRLRQVKIAAEKLTKDLLKKEGFIWQRDGFELELAQTSAKSHLLRGRTNYGDSVDDEWLVVYLLRELSARFPDIWIRVVDSDGQFLLIEAANALPIWLNPEVADFRVWIHSGKLLLIPLEHPNRARSFIKDSGVGGGGGSDGADNLSLEDALRWIADPDRKLLHSKKIEAEAFFRLRNYPRQISGCLHHACVLLPRKVAYLLHSNAAYISGAVEAFYLRDLIALKVLREKEASKQIFPPVDLVAMSVTFTKVGFAQLRGQQFETPKAWRAAIDGAENEKERMRAEIGMKVSCGFEMLFSDQMHQDKPAVREMKLLLEDVDAGEARLPSDADVQSWGLQDDDDGWLDIDFNEFEKELAGNTAAKRHRENAGFGDRTAQENLQKIVERFKGLLQDESADPTNSGLVDEMDNDDEKFEDSESDDSVSSDDANHINGNDAEPDMPEDEFTAMMREMMGMPPEVMKELMTNPRISGDADVEILPAKNADEDEGEDILRAMEQTGRELREAGVLDVQAQSDRAD